MTVPPSPTACESAEDWGDFVDTEDELDVEMVAESIESYQNGTNYPLVLGEVLEDRYQIQHKLGHGGFATVWLAQDLMNKTHVAIKINAPGEPGEREYLMQDQILREAPDTSRLLLAQDTFLLSGRHDKHHRVLVLPLRGPNLRDHRIHLSVASRMSAAKQLLEAIKSLHSINIVHRDITPGNVLFSVNSLTTYPTASAKYEVLTRPRKFRMSPDCNLSKVGDIVAPLKYESDVVGADLALGDFGIAIKVGTLTPACEKHAQGPPIYNAPERMHGYEATFASDMWAFMCIFIELYSGHFLFRGSGPKQVMTDMTNTLGPLPEPWKGKYILEEQDEQWYNSDRATHGDRELEGRIRRLRPDVSDKERHLVMHLLKKGLSYVPECRLSAEELLIDSTFQAIFEIYGVS